MLTYAQLLQPKTVEDALTLMDKNKFSPFYAGGCWTRLGRRRMPSIIDLSGLNLRYIKEENGEFVIGAMTTQREVETHDVFQTFCHGILPKAVSPILGVQFRNMATIGGSVAAKFGFSDIMPALLALKADVVLARLGRISLVDYLQKNERDLLLEVRFSNQEVPVACEALRKSVSDFPYLTGSIRKDTAGYSLYIGSRPMGAVKAVKASQALSTKGLAGLEEAARLVSEELKFQTNSHASAEYRQLMSINMTKRLVKEVEAWK